jgi:hypothetical protein
MEIEIKDLNENIKALTERLNYIIFRLPGIESKINSLFHYFVDLETGVDKKIAHKLIKLEEELKEELTESFNVFINRNNPLLIQLELNKQYTADDPNIYYSILIYGKPINIYSFYDEFLRNQIKKGENIIESKCKEIFCIQHGATPVVNSHLDILNNTFKIMIECCCQLQKAEVLKHVNNKEAFFTDKLDIKV